MNQQPHLYLESPVEEVLLTQSPRSYIVQNFESWLHDGKNRILFNMEPHQLVFIRGCVKGTTRWEAIAQTPGFTETRRAQPMSFKPFDHVTSQLGTTEPDDDDIPQDQCFFVKYYKVKPRRSLFKKIKNYVENFDPLFEIVPNVPSVVRDNHNTVLLADIFCCQEPTVLLDEILDYILQVRQLQPHLTFIKIHSVAFEVLEREGSVCWRRAHRLLSQRQYSTVFLTEIISANALSTELRQLSGHRYQGLPA